MALCGFNKDMLKGLELFHFGLAENKIRNKHKENKESLEDN